MPESVANEPDHSQYVANLMDRRTLAELEKEYDDDFNFSPKQLSKKFQSMRRHDQSPVAFLDAAESVHEELLRCIAALRKRLDLGARFCSAILGDPQNAPLFQEVPVMKKYLRKKNLEDSLKKNIGCEELREEETKIVKVLLELDELTALDVRILLKNPLYNPELQ